MQRSLNIRSGALLRLGYLESVQRLRHATCTQNSPMPFSEIPKIPSLSFIGSAWMYLPLIGRYNIRDGSRAAWDIYQRYGPIVAQHLPGRRVIVRLFSANDIRTLYQEEGKTPHHVGSLPLKLYHQSRKPKFFANDGLLHSCTRLTIFAGKVTNGGGSDLCHTTAFLPLIPYKNTLMASLALSTMSFLLFLCRGMITEKFKTATS